MSHFEQVCQSLRKVNKRGEKVEKVEKVESPNQVAKVVNCFETDCNETYETWLSKSLKLVEIISKLVDLLTHVRR